jgi:retron-type reverse transcriptase
MGKWLNAGAMEGLVLSHPDAGTPQGGVISPLLANIYLHEVLDEWFVRDVQPRLSGPSVLVRYADDRAPRRRGKEAARPTESSLAA